MPDDLPYNVPYFGGQSLGFFGVWPPLPLPMVCTTEVNNFLNHLVACWCALRWTIILFFKSAPCCPLVTLVCTMVKNYPLVQWWCALFCILFFLKIGPSSWEEALVALWSLWCAKHLKLCWDDWISKRQMPRGLVGHADTNTQIQKSKSTNTKQQMPQAIVGHADTNTQIQIYKYKASNAMSSALQHWLTSAS